MTYYFKIQNLNVGFKMISIFDFHLPNLSSMCVRELKFLIHQSVVGGIIGKGGEKIKEIRNNTGANVKVRSRLLLLFIFIPGDFASYYRTFIP